MSLDELVNRYVVTSAQAGATPHRGFQQALESYAKHNKAEILVVPLIGSDKDDKYHPSLQKYRIVEKFEFSKHFLLEDFPIIPQQIRPLTGLGRFIQHNKSAVFGNPKQHLECLATSNKDMPKILTTTGALTRPNYRTQFRIGDIAQRDHTYGALVVEVHEDGDFQYRHISANSDGSFCDISTRYSPNHRPQKSYPDALVLGDWHTGSTDVSVRLATYQMIQDLKPKYVIVHDLFDGYSISHHEQHRILKRSQKASNKQLNLKDELEKCGQELWELYNLLPKDGKIIVVKSNHDEFLDRYLEEGRFGSDPENLKISCYLAQKMLEGEDPLKIGIEHVYGSFGKWVKFLERDEDFKVRGWQLGAHGDLGGNGSRGSVTQQQNNYGRSIVGHRHTPAIRGEAWCVGTSTKLKLDYNRGPSNWMHTHALVYKTGKPVLINIINGEYKF